MEPNKIATRVELKEQELKLLFEVYKKDPKLFERPTFIEDAKTLEDFGIYIPNKQSFPFGVIKFLPQDFIVEEVSEAGEIRTIKKENILSQDTAIPDGPTIYATLVKCGISTMNATFELAKFLSCSPEQIRHSGLKDTAAITAQRISFRQISLNQLKAISSKSFFLKDVESGKGVLEKGQLKGNQFTIFVRVEKDFFEPDTLKIFTRQLEKISQNGFYNYFYVQRFGTPRLGAHYWGLDLVHGYYRRAVENFLSFGSPHEIIYFKNIRREVGRCFGNWDAMLNLLEPFPLIFFNELKITNHLKNHPDDFAGALSQIQDQTNMWVSAFSSWMFNLKIASYLKKGQEPPEALRLFLDPANSSGEVYKNVMEDLRVSVTDFRNLRRLPFIQAPRKPIKTKELIKIDKAEILDSGIVFKFFLPKGEYATTFLSHLFNLIGDRPPIDVDQSSIDAKAIIGDDSAAPTIEHFLPIIHPKSQNYFEELLKEEGGQ